MDTARVATIYMSARESFVGSEMAFTLTFRVPFEPSDMLASFEAFVRRHQALRLRLERGQPEARWVPLSDGEVEAALAEQRGWFERLFTTEEVQSRRQRPGTLPIRLFRAGERCLILQMSHLLGNGLRALQWIEHWLSHGEATGSAVWQRSHPGPPRPGVLGWFRLVAFAAQFVARAGWEPGRNTVDLTHRKAPVPHRSGYAVRTYAFAGEDTGRIVEHSRALGLSVTQALCAAMASALFAVQPDKKRVCISVPTNLGRLAPGSFQDTPGDYTGHLIVQVRRERAAGPQILRAFQWLQHGIDALLPLALAAMAGDERALHEKFAKAAARPVPSRAPFQNHSCTVSNLGVVRFPAICRLVETLSACTHTQSLSVSMATIGDRLSMEVIVSRDLYDPAEVFRVTDAAAAWLVGSH